MTNHDLTGAEFPAFRVVGRHGPPDGRNTLWDCVCRQCGKSCVIVQRRLGEYKSCGCLLGLAQQDLWNRNRKYHLDGTQINTLLPTRAINKNSKTGLRGVSRMKSGGYRAYINLRGRQIHLGRYGTPEEAAAAREAAEDLYYAPLIEQWAEEYGEPPKPRGKYQRETPPSNLPVGITLRRGTYSVHIYANGKTYNAGSCKSLEEAVRARDQAAADIAAGRPIQPVRYRGYADFDMRAAREALGITRQEIARQLGVDTHTIGAYERRVSRMTPETLKKIRKILKLSE